MSTSVTHYSIIMNITFIIETTERYFIKLIASKLMIAASNGFHGMMHLFVINQYILIVFIFDFVLYYILFNTFGCFSCLLCKSTFLIANQQILLLVFQLLRP